MDERKCISLIYQYNDNWIGGTYYIINIINALNLLDDTVKPEINILYDKVSSLSIIKAINYPYINFVEWNFTQSFSKRLINKIYAVLAGARLFKKNLPANINENVYPITTEIAYSKLKRSFFWIPDFQERYLPQFFTQSDIAARKTYQEEIVKSGKGVVFSSHNALNDFNKFYPHNNNEKVVLNFVSFPGEEYKQISITTLKEKFNLDKPFFFVANQFWAHKNHKVVFEAIKILKDLGHEFLVLFSGKQEDYRNPDYIVELKKYANENGIDKNIALLGFIDRNEQLQLMKHALAVIQPSFFEGWGTVVEDVKAINNFMLVSKIPVHQEQCTQNYDFFSPDSPQELSSEMAKMLINRPVCVENNYEQRQLKFARDVIAMFNN